MSISPPCTPVLLPLLPLLPSVSLSPRLSPTSAFAACHPRNPGPAPAPEATERCVVKLHQVVLTAFAATSRSSLTCPAASFSFSPRTQYAGLWTILHSCTPFCFLSCPTVFTASRAPHVLLRPPGLGGSTRPAKHGATCDC